MRVSGKKVLALGLALAMITPVVSTPNTADVRQVEAATSRVGEAGNLEIPGTVSTFDDYNTSFLSVTGFAEEGVNDRTDAIGTSKYRKVSTPAEFLDAIKAAKRGSYTDESGKTVTPVSQGSVTVIEVMNDIDLGKIVGSSQMESGVNDVQSQQGLNNGYTVTHTGNFPGVTAVSLDDINGLTIFSANGSEIEHCTFNIGSGGTAGVGSNDIVIRNLKFDGCWQWDNTGSQKEGGWAYMKIYKSSNIWIDHCTFTIAIDGNVDIESGANGITLSWCKFGMETEEALEEGSVVRDSIEYMEQKYQTALKNANKKGGMTTIINTYDDACKKVKEAGYDPSKDSSIKKLQAENSALYKTYNDALTAYKRFYSENTNILINKGKIYADMRMAGATMEDIIAYAAYHSKVHLVGSGDREFKDMDKESALTINADGTYTLDPNGEYIEDGNSRLELTLAYDCYNNVGQRVPMIRMGTGHMFNCYLTNAEHNEILQKDAIKKYGNERLQRAINARDGGAIGADTCVFESFDQPIIGNEIQGNDIGNMNAPWDSLYATAINFSTIVNSKITDSKGKTYSGSSWDNGGNNLFTGNGYGLKYSDTTLGKFCWDRKIVSLGGVPVENISRNVLALGDYKTEFPIFTWHKNREDEQSLKIPSCLVKLKNEDGTAKTNGNGSVMYEPFQWEYNYDAKLEYEYQMVELDQVSEVVPQYSGAGVVKMLDSSSWLRTTYEKGENLVEGDMFATPTPVPTPTPEPTPTPVTPSPIVTEIPTPTPTPTPVTPSPIVPETPTPDPVVFKMGDVDNNGEVNLADAQLTLKVALKIQTLSDEDYPASLAADVDKDGSITLSDAKKILRYALKIDTEF